MEQHAVPQNISSYEFRLVGDMTLKQFFQLAGGIVLGVITFRLPLPIFIKYPLVFIFVMAGILMAFVPIMGRPFTAWITAFFRAIYSPTEFTWAPDTEVPILVNAPQTVVIPTATNPPDIVTTAPTVVVPQPVPVVPTEPIKPVVTKETSFSTFTPIPKPAIETKSPVPVPEPVKPVEKITPKPVSNNVVQPPINPKDLPSVDIPLKNIAPVSTPQIKPTTNNPQPTTNSVPVPTSPNILAGIVADKSGVGIDSAIVEIIDSVTQVPARALRTNKTGLFQIVTPLRSGTYEIHAEKDGFTFSAVSVIAQDKIIQPLLIKAT